MATKAKLTLMLLMVLGLAATGVGMAAMQPKTTPAEERAAGVGRIENPSHGTKAPADRYGDALPEGALSRLGTLRQRAADAHVAISADGKDIITVGSQMTVRVWDAATGELRSLKQLPDAGSHRTYLSPRGKYLLSDSHHAKNGRRLIVWDLAGGRLAHSLPLPNTALIEGASFSADERRVAIAECSNPVRFHYIRVWELESGRVRTLHEYEKRYTSYFYDPVVQFTPNGTKLVALQRDNKMRCWDLSTDKLVWHVDPRYSQSHFFCFTPDSKAIFTSGNRVIDVATGQSAPFKAPPGEPLIPLAFSPDGRLLALLTYQEGILFWEMATSTTALQVPKADRADDGLFIPERSPTNFAFTPDGTGFIWRHDVIQRWNLANGKPLFPETREWGHTEAVTNLVFSPDGKLLASGAKNERKVRLWDLATARTRHTLPAVISQQLAFLPHGRHLLVPCSVDKTVLRSWDTTTGWIERGFEVADRKQFMVSSGNKEIRVTADGKKVLMLTFKNGRRNDESILTVWDSANGECLRHERVPWGEDSVLTPDGAGVLAFDSASGDVMLRRLDTTEVRWRMPLDSRKEPHFYGCDLSLSPDGRLLAARVRFYNHALGLRPYGDLRLGDTATGRQFMRLSVAGSAVFAFSPDNRLLAVADAEGVRFWEVAARQEVGFLPAPNRDALPPDHACATALAFAPDSLTLATGHMDSTILLWDATFRKGPTQAPLADAERYALWIDLAGADAVRAQTAFWRFVSDPKPTTGFLSRNLTPVTALAPELMRSLLRDLSSDQFKMRVAAEQQLRAYGARTEPALRAALKANISLETTRRVEAILAALDPSSPLVGESLRHVRAVQILERIASPEARNLLAQLSEGVGAAPLTRTASESLERMRKP